MYHNLETAITEPAVPGLTQVLLDVSKEINPLSFSWSLTPFEKSYDGSQVLQWTQQNYWMAPLASVIYLAFIYFGPRFMANHKPFDLSSALKYWNLFLAVYSIIGVTRVVPYLFLFLSRFGWTTTLCAPCLLSFGRGPVGLWTMFFIYSKFFELIDTVFIILRKKKLSFLHWYHHVTVLMYTWDAFVNAQPPGLYYCGMNYTVHAIMYSYYYLAATQKKLPAWGVVVTILQIAQMIMGVSITMNCLYLAFKYNPVVNLPLSAASNLTELAGMCDLSKLNLTSAIGMYSTYFYLFAVFFVQRYISKPSKAARKKVE